MRLRGADKMVTAVVCWSHHKIARSEGVEGGQEGRCWQVRAIAIESDDPPPARCREMCEHRGETRPKALAGLCYQAHSAAGELRQFLDIRSPAHNRNFHTR